MTTTTKKRGVGETSRTRDDLDRATKNAKKRFPLVTWREARRRGMAHLRVLDGLEPWPGSG